METKSKRLLELYNLATRHKLVKSKGEFAKLIGVEAGSLSHALKDDGKVSVDNAITKAEHALLRAGISINASGDGNVQTVTGNNNQIGMPPKNFDIEQGWFALVAEKDKQIDRLLSIIEKLSQ